MGWGFASRDPLRGMASARIERGMPSNTCRDPIYPPLAGSGENDRVLFLGPDQYGVPLEVLAVELAGGELLVLHAMKLRRKYRRDYEMVMAWQRRS